MDTLEYHLLLQASQLDATQKWVTALQGTKTMQSLDSKIL